MLHMGFFFDCIISGNVRNLKPQERPPAATATAPETPAPASVAPAEAKAVPPGPMTPAALAAAMGVAKPSTKAMPRTAPAPLTPKPPPRPPPGYENFNVAVGVNKPPKPCLERPPAPVPASLPLLFQKRLDEVRAKKRPPPPPPPAAVVAKAKAAKKPRPSMCPVLAEVSCLSFNGLCASWN